MKFEVLIDEGAGRKSFGVFATRASVCEYLEKNYEKELDILAKVRLFQFRHYSAVEVADIQLENMAIKVMPKVELPFWRQ